ncbi:hypothetical protein DTO027B5_4538 [Paecilomyces variotii]|nr:hypothetical protein DTO027B3_5469 [Paecilomyces variotii]KAJ9333758.1 hypothetical protein DTO027B5_4538 [Paecilomyces variotii]
MAQPQPHIENKDVIPGTVHLVDLQGKMQTAHAEGKQHDVVLVPKPSDDPDDPLNWSPRRKMLSTSCMCMYTLMVGIASAAIYSILVPISEDTGLTLGDLNAGTGYMFLFFGWGCLVWQPLALQYGKRPVYLFSTLATMAMMIWAPYTKSNGQWIANKILQGFFGAPIESLCEVSVTDIYFTHERGAYIGLYAFMLAGSNFLAPVLAGFINDGQDWKWVLYWCAIFCGIAFVYLFFFLEETNYDRKPLAVEVSDTPLESSAESIESQTAPTTTEEKTPRENPPADVDYEAGEMYKKKSYLDKLRLFDRPRPFKVFQMMWRPLSLFSFPIVVYSGFAYGSNLVWFNVLNGTSSLILGSAPYNFSSSMVGLSYVSAIIGVGLSSLFSGKFGDWLMIRLARRKKGIHESEHRLWLFAINILLTPFALILWGVGAAHGVHWFGLIFGMGVLAFTITIGIQASVSYCVDTYKDLSGEALVTVIIIRNTMSFAVGYGITPWVTNMGYQNAFLVAAFVGLAQALTFLIFVKWGKGWREMSKHRYWKYVEKSGHLGTH